MQIEQLTPAEPGWRAVFNEPDGTESLSRVVGWAILGGEESEISGVIVDPADPSRIIPASGAFSPGGGEFARYRFVPPDPIVLPAPAAPLPAAEREDAPEQLAEEPAQAPPLVPGAASRRASARAGRRSASR